MAQPRKWSTPNQSATVGTRKKVTAVMAKAAARQRRPRRQLLRESRHIQPDRRINKGADAVLPE